MILACTSEITRIRIELIVAQNKQIGRKEKRHDNLAINP
jgi:hypothetical protein